LLYYNRSEVLGPKPIICGLESPMDRFLLIATIAFGALLILLALHLTGYW
jgi:hypothetical protein